MAEAWRPVVGWEGMYEVSDAGRVRSRVKRWKGGPRVLRPCQVNVGNGRRPRYAVILIREGKRHSLLVHRLVLIAFVGPCPPGKESRHLNDDPSDNRLENLAWGTRLENAADAKRNGIRRTGERNGRAKLTREQVLYVRAQRGKVTQQRLADELGVNQTTISSIQLGRLWGDID